MYWTDASLQDYRLQPPQSRTPMPVGARDFASLIGRSLADFPDSPALIGRFERLTFARLDARIRNCAETNSQPTRCRSSGSSWTPYHGTRWGRS